MYLDSREGTDYGDRLNRGYTFKNAWFEAAKKWQMQSTTDVIARVTGHVKRESLSLNVIYSAAPWYINDSSNYVNWTITIPGTGQRI